MGESQRREDPTDRLVLVVTPDEGLSDYLAFLITASGYKAFVANDERAALVLAADQRPHLVLLDTAMPGRSAVDICQRLRRLRLGREFWISALTDEVRDERDKKSDDLFDHYLRKPVELVSLRRLLDDYFGQETEKQLHVGDRGRIGPLPVRMDTEIGGVLLPIPALLRPAIAS